MLIKSKKIFSILLSLIFFSFIPSLSKAENNYLKINYGISSHDLGISQVKGYNYTR